jgi:hypothetical protein
VKRKMKALISSLVVSGVLASAANAAASIGTDGSSDWSLTLGGQTSLFSDVSFVSTSGDGATSIGIAAATLGGPTPIADTTEDRKGLPTVIASSEGEAGSLPSVPLPAPVLLAGIGVLGLMIANKRTIRVLR